MSKLELNLKVDEEFVETASDISLMLSHLLDDYCSGRNVAEFEQFVNLLGYEANSPILSRDISRLRTVMFELQKAMCISKYIS